MRTKWMWAAAVFQVLILGYMAGEREWIARTGRIIHLRTAPIDPRDVMRGDYVRLDYEIARVSRALWRDGLAATNSEAKAFRRQGRVYASLVLNESGLADLVALSDRKPKDGLYVRGRVDQPLGGDLMVRYGLEAYFMEQGRALELEQGRIRDGLQVPLEMEVAVGAGGLAVLKSHAWRPLGIGLELISTPVSSTNRVEGARVQGAKLRLLNSSKSDLAIVDLPEGRSLALAADRTWQDPTWSWVHAGEAAPRPEPRHVILLQPGQVHEISVDFKQPYWFVTQTNPPPNLPVSLVPRPMGDITEPWSAQFRLVYRPPDKDACRHLPQAGLIWHGRLPSRVFTPAGRVD